MSDIKISNFIVATIVASLVITLLAMFMGSASKIYGLNYDNTTLETYNTLDEIANITEDVKEETETIQEKSGVLDVIGGFFNDGYKALKLTVKSFNVVDSMANDATKQLNLGEAGRLIRVAIGTILITLIFIGVVISAIVKKDL